MITQLTPPRRNSKSAPIKAKAKRPPRSVDLSAYARPSNDLFNKQGASFSVRALADGSAEINLYDEIGLWGVTAKRFREVLDGIDADKIVLNINSPGGDVFDGVAILNDLLAHKASVVVRVTGLAASIASVIAMAGDEIQIADSAFFMIHNAWTVAIGDSRVMADRAKVLAKIDTQLNATYATRTGCDPDQIAEMCDAETWLTADEAIELGFADSLISAKSNADAEARAAFDLDVFRNAPRALARAREAKKAAPTPQKADNSAAILAAIAAANVCAMQIYAA